MAGYRSRQARSRAAFIAKGGGSAVLQFNPNTFPGATQTARIKNAIAAMKAAAGLATMLTIGVDTVTVPNTSVWTITEAILVGNNMTILQDGSTVKLADGTFDNVYRNDGINPDPANPNGKVLSVTKNTNIKILGINGAKVEGPTVVYSAPHPVNGAAAVPWVGDDYGWRTCNITLANVDGFEIAGFRSDKPRAWAITCSHGVKNGSIHDLDMNSNVLNGDGIDIRNGCNDIHIDRITGNCHDDIVAICAAVPFADGSPYPMLPLGYESNPLGDDTYNIFVDGVSGNGNNGNVLRAFTSGDQGTSLHHIYIKNIHQTGGIRCVNIGTFGAYTPPVGALHDIYVDGVVADTAPVGVQITARLVDSEFKNLTASAANATPYSWSSFNRDGSLRTTFVAGTVLPRFDPVLTNGSLVLADMAHPKNPYTLSSTVADNMVIPNVAYNEAIALAGGSLASDWNIRVGTGMVTTGTTPEAKLAKTGKGGIEVSMSRTNDVSARGLFVGARSNDTKLTQYLLAYPGHSYYLSVWERTAREAIASTPEPASSIVYANNVGTNDIAMRMDRAASSGPGAQSAANPALPQPAGNNRRSLKTTGYSGAAPTTAANVHALLWVIGNQIEGSTTQHKSRSAALYRIYLEDLTVSQRTFDQVDAIDAAEWAKAIGSGGRYEAASETFTDPTTVA
jgi:hypothetical protein